MASQVWGFGIPLTNKQIDLFTASFHGLHGIQLYLPLGLCNGLLTHWGRVRRLNLTIIGSGNGVLSIGPLRTNCGEILIKNTTLFVHENAYENMVYEMATILSCGRWVKIPLTKTGNFNNVIPQCELQQQRTSCTYSISQEICTRFLLCCALLWLYID